MSNDSWFAADGMGARMHQTVAAFRSIETGLPQFRVTTNGYSAAIDATGQVLAGSRIGEQTLVIAALPARTPAPTLMVRWGDWVGRAACVFLMLLAAWLALPAARARAATESAAPVGVAVLPGPARLAAGVLRLAARAGLLWIGIALLQDESLRTNTLAQMRLFGALFLVPEALAWSVLFVYAAEATIDGASLVLTRGREKMAFALADIAAVRMWRVPLPCAGLSLQLADGGRWRYGLALSDPGRLTAALAAAGGPRVTAHTVMQTYAQAALALRRSRLDHPAVKYLLLPLALAMPAFHLHQHIAYGGAFGEYHTFGLTAYLSAFALWWAAWAIGVVLCEALLRAAIGAATLAAAVFGPERTPAVRRELERAGHAALFLGLPAWLCMTIYGA